MCMLNVDTLMVRVKPMRMMKNELVLSSLTLHGAKAVGYKERKDTAANFQFFLDAFKSEKKPEEKKQQKKKSSAMTMKAELKKLSISRTELKWDVKSEPAKGADSLDVNHIHIDHVNLAMRGTISEKGADDCELNGLYVSEKNSGSVVSLEQLTLDTKGLKKKNVLSLKNLYAKGLGKELKLESISAEQEGTKIALHQPVSLAVSGLEYKDKKNDILASFEGKTNSFKPDSIDAELSNVSVKDRKKGSVFSLDSIQFHAHDGSGKTLLASGLKAYMKSNKKIKEQKVGFKTLKARQKGDGKFTMTDTISLAIDGITYWTDNHLPRKNVNKPNRGAFDAGHLDLTANLKANINLSQVKEGTVTARITHLDAVDKGSSLILKNLTAGVVASKDIIKLPDLMIKMPRTKLSASNVNIHTKNFHIDEFPITADAYLQDLAKPFAKRLSDFSTPLKLSLRAGGNLDRFYFKNILVTSFDNRLHMTAQGDLCNVTKKQALCLHFTNINLTARKGIKEQIANHFSKKIRLKMMREMKAVGDIKFNGTLGIFYKLIKVGGLLSCKHTNLNFNFGLDGKTHFMTGSASTQSVDLGAIVNMKDLWIGPTKADFSIDLTNKKKRPAATRHGRLPIGKLKARISEAKVSIAKFRDISANVNSDGCLAKGDLEARLGLLDAYTTFEFLETDTKQEIKVHPKFRLSKKNNKEYEADKAKKLKEKEARKAQKEAEKQEKKALKEQEKLQKQKEKEARKAQKAAEKQARKEQKEREKQAKKEQE
ncbi:MAG: hypothetical protein HUK08_05780 [Bacteroidaceae bacterium]|nr:hypothetical protein [Bacteroidaceae bacterium]